jgi:hypothetical protein
LPNVTLADWRKRITAGRLPIVVFNATLVETGQRYVLSPVKRPPLDEEPPKAHQAQDLYDLYGKQATVKSVTAARLSATFPYITPICRPYPRDGVARDNDYHVADGGYFDNEGIFTAAEWIKAILDKPDRPFDRIILIRIQPSPVALLPEEASVDSGWGFAFLGPLKTITAVRSASQLDRNDLDVRLLETAVKERRRAAVNSLRRLREEKLRGEPFGLSKLQEAQRQESVIKVEFKSITIRYEDPDQQTEGEPLDRKDRNSDVPLSWKLTDRQKSKIERAWQALRKRAKEDKGENPLKELGGYFGVQ